IYGLPIWAFAGATDSKVMDAQAGAESMFSIVTSLLSRCNLIHDVGYIEYGNTSCLEMITMANEFVEMCKSFVRGIPVNEETLALDAIRRIGTSRTGEIFLSDTHTFKNFMKAHFLPKLISRSRYEAWTKAGSMDLYRRC
ncbi:MAG: trimethylamine methyltransferase family protein, partial [Deltaproteobacteria bacterium]|nr:trimethylamine methyltransferase family protein [Deltaproteobacteria bacterium]